MNASSAFRSVRIRAALSLGLVLGLGSVATLAAWSTTASTTSGTFVTGTVDIKFDDGTPLGNQGNPDPFALTLQAGTLVPGQSRAGILKVVNAGNVPLRYTGSVSNEVGGPTLTASFATGAAGTNGVCGGTSVALSTSRALLVGQSESLCVQVTLSTAAPATDQGKAGAIVVVLSAQPNNV